MAFAHRSPFLGNGMQMFAPTEIKPIGAMDSGMGGSSDATLLRDKLTLLLESTGEGIYGIDLEGRCTFINRAAADMIGCEPDEALGRNMHEVTHHSHPDGRPYAEHDCPIFNAFRQGLPCR